MFYNKNKKKILMIYTKHNNNYDKNSNTQKKNTRQASYKSQQQNVHFLIACPFYF